MSKLIPDVLRLINDVYGWTADSPAKRQEIRDRVRKSVEDRIAELDKRVQTLMSIRAPVTDGEAETEVLVFGTAKRDRTRFSGGAGSTPHMLAR